MLLQQFHTNLFYGELYNIIADRDTQGVLPYELAARVNVFLNEGLTALYGRFPLLEKELIIDAQDEISLYYLRPEFGMTNGVAPVKYIRDTVEDPFLGDVIQITRVYNEIGEELPLNEPEIEGTLYLPKFDCLQILEPVTGNSYTVFYRAKHAAITGEDLAAEIDIPSYLETALRCFVAGKIYSSMNGAEHVATGMNYLSQFEERCNDVDRLNHTRNSQFNEMDKFTDRGFC